MSPAATPSALAPVPAAAAAGQLPGLAQARGRRRAPGLVPFRDGRIALADTGRGRAVSYQQLTRTIRAAAAGLARRGVRPDDVVGLHVADAVAFSIGSLAVRAAGAVPFPVTPGAAAGEAAAQLAASDVRILLTCPALATGAAGLAGSSRVRQVICFGRGADRTPPGMMPFSALLEYGTMRPITRGGGDPALLCCSPGPRGQRHPAWVSYRALAADLRRLAGGAPVNDWDVVIAAPPCGDGRRYTALLDLALAQQATVIASASADPGDLLAAARKHLATAVIAPAPAGLPDELPLRVLTVPS